MTVSASNSAVAAFVRQLSDEQIAQLVERAHHQEAEDELPTPSPASAGNGASITTDAPKAARQRKKKTSRRKSSAGGDLDTKIVEVIHSNDGLAVSEVAIILGADKARVAAACKRLREAKKIFMGGKRRFARYASTAKAAKAASIRARKSN